MIIAVDFDGTCVTHEYPDVGKDIGAVPVLQEMVACGHQLILYTMRDKATLMDAVDWFQKNKIELWGINKNPDQSWTTSPKVFANVYIDDAALGVPLVHDTRLSNRPFVDWDAVHTLFHRGLPPKPRVASTHGVLTDTFYTGDGLR